ncbi:hypothetical protein [Paracoccus versutus]|uniref:hypothetical protein n=1 Tax=Paracoccus versutus TaxID=34007 RepID=UPI0011C033DC|nr:hypothetical protein [Paracoccus versutus]
MYIKISGVFFLAHKEIIWAIKNKFADFYRDRAFGISGDSPTGHSSPDNAHMTANTGALAAIANTVMTAQTTRRDARM